MRVEFRAEGDLKTGLGIETRMVANLVPGSDASPIVWIGDGRQYDSEADVLITLMVGYKPTIQSDGTIRFVRTD